MYLFMSYLFLKSERGVELVKGPTKPFSATQARARGLVRIAPPTSRANLSLQLWQNPPPLLVPGFLSVRESPLGPFLPVVFWKSSGGLGSMGPGVGRAYKKW